MPELPEVETLKMTLSKLILGKTISRVEVRLPRLIRQPSVQTFVESLRGLRIEGIARRGKYLLLQLPPLTLVMHMRMEGKLSLHSKDVPEDKHVHVIFYFTDDTELRYKDVRQFGTMDLVDQEELRRVSGLRDLGLEPLSPSFTLEAFRHRLTAHPRSMLKAALLDQQIIAGLGNIYTDEVLFLAKLHPMRPVQRLQKRHYQDLYEAIIDVLTRAVAAGGASVRSYLNGRGEMGYFQLQIHVYGKKGEPCPRCGRPIKRIIVAGRGTHLCTYCQRLPRK